MDRPRRMDGYIRVSQNRGHEAPAYARADVQLERIQRWADARRIEIACWHYDDDGTVGGDPQPALAEALERIERGESDGIACWRLDRFARTAYNALRDIRRVRDGGGTLAFIEEGLDPTGPCADLLLPVLEAVTALHFDLDARRRSVRRSYARAVAEGRTNAMAPFGYVRADDGLLEPHPTEADIVREAFARARRDGLRGCMEYLREAAPDRAWTTTTVRRVLENRAYLGEARNHLADGDEAVVNPDAHPALVDPVTFRRAQPPPPQRRAPRERFPLSGIAACGTCGETMIGAATGAPRRRYYRCRAAWKSSWKGEPCPAPATVDSDALEAYVLDALEAAERASNGSTPRTAMVRKLPPRQQRRVLSELVERVVVRRAPGGRWTADNLAERVHLELAPHAGEAPSAPTGA